ncbi:hypothetical protein V6N13_010471 [Hibiscus sabdariffa]
MHDRGFDISGRREKAPNLWPNKLEEKRESRFLKILDFMWNPLSWVMEAAAIMAIVLANGGGKPPDWPDFVGIISLLFINSTISFIEENNASNAAAALMAGLAPKTKVLRDGKWGEQEAAILVPGDVISVKLGDIIPADARLLEGDALKIDQSALTGESLPVTKNPVLSGKESRGCVFQSQEVPVIVEKGNVCAGHIGNTQPASDGVAHECNLPVCLPGSDLGNNDSENSVSTAPSLEAVSSAANEHSEASNSTANADYQEMLSIEESGCGTSTDLLSNVAAPVASQEPEPMQNVNSLASQEFEPMQNANSMVSQELEPMQNTHSMVTRSKRGEIEAVVIATGVHTFFGKAAHLVHNTNNVGHFQQVLTAIGNFCICSIAVGMLIEILVMYPIQQRGYRDGIDNLLVLLIGGIPIAMPTVLSVTMAIGSHRLSQQGAITKRMTAIEEMAGMDVLCSDKTGTLTLNKLTVDKSLIEVFVSGMDADNLMLIAARASRVENQDAIDASIIGMLGDPKEARAGITEVHFLPFNPVGKRTAITYIDKDGEWHRCSKGAPEQIIELCQLTGDLRQKALDVIDSFANRGLRSLGVARQTIPEKTKGSAGGPWEFVGLLPLFDPPRHDSAETIRQALKLGVNVKMITGDQLAIGIETGRRLGMGTNMYSSSSLLGQSNDDALATITIDELIEKADGFAGVFPEHKYEIVKRLQELKHICGMTGDGVNDAPALKKADIGIAVADATDAARSASDIVLTEPGLSVIVSAVLTSRVIFQRMKNYTIYAVSITIRIVLGFMLVVLIWEFDFSPFMVLIIAILNDGTIMTISKDRVKPSPLPDSWKLKEIFTTGVVLGAYMAIVSVIFFWLVHDTQFFTEKFGVKPINDNTYELTSALYLQVATCIAVYANWGFARIQGIGWEWAGIIWPGTICFRTRLHSRRRRNMERKGGRHNGQQTNVPFTAFHPQKPAVPMRSINREMTEIAEQAKKRAEIARELHTLKGRVESMVKLKGLDITIQQHYTV